jgi:hypothetical protein
MSASILPPDIPLQRSNEPDLLRLLDKLATDACTQEEFLRAVQRLEQVDPDVGWEVLALLDQYFRRKKLSPALFVSVKKRLEQRHLAGAQAEPLPEAPSGAEAPASAEASASGNTQPAWRAGFLICGRYRITDVLRRSPGEMLVEAVDEVRAGLAGVRQRVAIHVLDTGESPEPGLLLRLCALQALSHPGIVRVFDVDAEPGVLYLTRELLNGRSLQTLVEQYGQRLDPSAAQMILASVASALAHAHSRDVFHGDVNATNIFIADVGEVKLTGFRLRFTGPAPAAAADHLAFARLAYELLSGSPAPPERLPGESKRALLPAPPGVTREQWRALHDTLTGKGRGKAGNVLSLFGGSSSTPTANVTLLRTGTSAPVRTGGKVGWIATGLVASLLATTTWLVATHDAESVPLAAAALEVADAPVPQLPAVPASPEVTTRPVVPVPVPQPAVMRPQLDLPTRVARVDAGQPVARIWVRRQGSLRGETTFLWWTESGTAEIDVDFREIPPRMATIANGARGVELLVPIVPNADRLASRAFYVKIDSPGPGAILGARNLTQVLILPNEGSR